LLAYIRSIAEDGRADIRIGSCLPMHEIGSAPWCWPQVSVERRRRAGSAGHSAGAPAGGATGGSSDAMTIHAMHTGAAVFANLND